MSNKKCKKCNLIKNVGDFPRNHRNKDGYNTICKLCTNAIAKKWRDNNKERFLERSRRNYYKHQEINIERNKAYYTNHIEEKREYDVQYRLDNKEKIAKFKKEWEQKKRNDPVHKIKRNLRRRIHHVIIDGYKSAHSFELIGCTAEEFKIHIESLFQEGMSWDNYGPKGWHIDHIIPCYKFDLSIAAEQRKCFHYTNQRPLWAKDNLSRRRKE